MQYPRLVAGRLGHVIPLNNLLRQFYISSTTQTNLEMGELSNAIIKNVLGSYTNCLLSHSFVDRILKHARQSILGSAQEDAQLFRVLEKYLQDRIILGDQDKGECGSISTHFPKALKLHCVRHRAGNVLKKYPSDVQYYKRAAQDCLTVEQVRLKFIDSHA
jgi:hypothetical protein